MAKRGRPKKNATSAAPASDALGALSSRSVKKQEIYKILKSIPRAVYLEMASRDPKTINAHSAKHNLHCSGPVVDLTKVIYAIHEMLTTVKIHTGYREEDGMLKGGQDSDGMERFRSARADKAEMEADLMRGTLVRRDSVHTLMSQSARLIREAGDRIGDEYGEKARKTLSRAVDAIELMVDRELPEPNQGGDSS